MEFLDGVPVWIVAGFVFSLRIVDVSLGTMRTLSVVSGRLKLSVLLGFFEILLWLTAVSQTILRVREHPVLMVAYAGGFATGNALGITLERKMALGRCVVRMISRHGGAIAEALRPFGTVLGTFESDSAEEHGTLVFAIFERRNLQRVLAAARAIDPSLFYVVERFSETSHLTPSPEETGWRALFKVS